MIYICIPAHNEEQTVGVVLWKIRQVMAEYPRDYQLLVVDDASTDRTPDVLAPYARVLPLTVVRTESKHGEGAAIEMMLREAVRRSEYPKRDMIITLQADFTQEPDELVALIKRMEAGADIVVGETQAGPHVSRWVRWARALALRVLGKARIPEGVRDPFTSYRAYRVAAVKAALAGRDNGRLVHWSGWAGAAELLLATAPNARRIDTVELIERRERLQRPSRLQPWAALRAVWSLAREARPLQVTSPADLDQAMRAIAAVRTSEVSARTGGRSERTQRQERTRGTSEERRPREGDKRREPTGRTGNASGGGRPEHGARPERTAHHERGAPKPRVARAGAERGTPAAGSEGRKPAPPVAAVVAGGGAEEAGVVGSAASGERPKRKRPRRRKRTGAANGGAGVAEVSAAVTGATAAPVAPDVSGAAEEVVSAANPNGGDSSAATAVFQDGAETLSPAASPGAADDAEGGAVVERPVARRRRRGRRGGRRRSNANGAQSEGDGSGGGEAAGSSAGGGAGGDSPEQIGIFELIEGERTNET